MAQKTFADELCELKKKALSNRSEYELECMLNSLLCKLEKHCREIAAMGDDSAQFIFSPCHDQVLPRLVDELPKMSLRHEWDKQNRTVTVWWSEK